MKQGAAGSDGVQRTTQRGVVRRRGSGKYWAETYEDLGNPNAEAVRDHLDVLDAGNLE